MRAILALVLAAALGGCSDDDAPTDGGAEVGADLAVDLAGDAAVDSVVGDVAVDAGDGGALPRVGPLHQLPLLPAEAPALPFNHSAETTIAADGDRVAVAFINMRFAGADTFDTTGFHKRVGVALSADGGESYASATIDPGGGDQTTDPVLRAAADGSFWLATWDTAAGEGALLSSADHGATWSVVASGIGLGDKEWIAIDDAGSSVFIGALAGYWRFGFDGALLGKHAADGDFMVGGYAVDGAAHLLSAQSGVFRVRRWDGASAPVVEGAELAGGKLGADLNVCGSIGRTVDGAQWIVRALRSEGQGSVALRVRRPPDDEGQELAISTPGKLAFMPAATLDGVGRMHVIWYEDGALLYARSETSDLAAGFAEPLVIDPQACPPPPWYPSATSSDGGRRLREYVDITVAGARAHLSWTHAPGPPSRVHATYVAFAL